MYSDNYHIGKMELIAIVAKRYQVPKSHVHQVLDQILETLADLLKDPNTSSINLQPLGIFRLKMAKARQTALVQDIPDRYKLVFRPTQPIKQAIKSRQLTAHDRAILEGRAHSVNQIRTWKARRAIKKRRPLAHSSKN